MAIIYRNEDFLPKEEINEDTIYLLEGEKSAFATSAIEFFSGLHSKQKEKPLFALDYPLPEYWSINSNGKKSATIVANGKEKGTIWMKEPYEDQFVDCIEWVCSDNQRVVDYFDQYGNRYKQQTFQNEDCIITQYFSSLAKPFLSVQHTLGYISLTYKQETMWFTNEKEFYLFFIDCIKEKEKVNLDPSVLSYMDPY